MGVMPCYRADCKNIMCDRYSEEFGYICSDCFEEMVAAQVEDIAKFMCTPRTKILVKKILRETYEEIFKVK